MMLKDRIANIFEGENGIFKDENVFDVHHLPEEFLFRDHQMKTLANNIKPAFRGGGPIHTVILGDYATGKTTAIKKLFEIIKNLEHQIIPVYINCKTYNTKFKIYSAIFEEVFQIQSLKRGTSSTLLFDKIMKELKEKEKILLIALDDVNYILKDKKVQKIFYELLRAYETFQVKIGVFPILTSLEFRYKFDKDIRTIFIPQEIIFPHYTLEETYAILKERAGIGFHDKAINQEILLRVSELTVEAKNIRLGLKLLHTLGILAENDGSPIIRIEYLNQLIKTQNKYL